jgi:ribosomal protein L19, bacterial type
LTNLVEQYEKSQIYKLTSKKRIPAFRPGDTIKVTLKIVEGEKSRLQAFEGMCIGRKNNSINSKFTLRKISHGEGVERVFPLFSSNIEKIEVIRKGDVQRAKLYYLRNRTGKRARVSDRDRGNEADQYQLLEGIDEATNIASEDNKETLLENSNKESDENSVETPPDVEEKPIIDEKSELPVPETENTENEKQ